MSISAQNIDTLHPQEDTNNQHRPLVIVLAGPTAVGKSDVAAKLCSSIISSDIIRGHCKSTHSSTDNTKSSTLSSTTNTYRGHVISADSVQAYTKVTIGANKPTSQEMKDTPHHLVNVVNPPNTDSTSTKNKVNSYNAADWMNDARYVIEKLGCVPTSKVDDDIDEEKNESDVNIEDEETILRRDAIDKAIKQSLQQSNSHDDKPIILPVVVGGTMMYLNWLCHGRPDAIRPTEEAVQRAANVIDGFQRQGEDMIESSNSVQVGLVEGDTTGETLEEEDDEETIAEAKDIAAWKVASTYVVSLGPVFKQRVEKLPGRDWYRLRRLLEVAYTIATKKKKKKKAADKADTNISDEEILQQLTEKEVYTGIRAGSLSDLGYDVRCFFLCPTDRMTHFHTVDERCEQMLLRGLLRETATLYVNGELPAESQVTRAIGYRQTLEYLKRPNAKSNDTKAFLAYIDVFATATRQYAKKQMQWFRRDDDFAFVPVQMDIDKSDRVDNAAQIISDMCKLDLAGFKAALSSDSIPVDDIGDQSQQLQLSAQTKLDNELQGKTMKYFISKRVHLVDGSDALLKVLAEADECTKVVQELGDEF